MTLLGQGSNPALKRVAARIKKSFGFRAFRAVVFGERRSMMIDTFAEGFCQQLGIRMALVGQCGNLALELIATLIE
jgi:hypothetical protein